MKHIILSLIFISSVKMSFAQDDSPPYKPLPIINHDTCKFASATDSCLNDITWVEEMPQFSGGTNAFLQYIAKNTNWPNCCKQAAENGIQGKVYLQFVVEKDGSVSNVKVVKGITASDSTKQEYAEMISQEAIRVVKSSPKWSAATQNGKPVRCMFSLPMHFKLN